MYNFKDNEVVILLGAGASVEAGIPHSARMINNLEELIATEEKWKDYLDLYNYIKSSIRHSSGIQGRFEVNNYNIETLVNTLDELVKKHEHTLYPFIGAWNPTLVERAGVDFSLIKGLKEKILEELRTKWLPIGDEESAGYYSGLLRFKNEYEFPLRIFSLNYDLCLETVCKKERINLELGFTKERFWNWRQFGESNESPDIYYYKLHGSIDWKYEKDKLTFDAPSRIAHKDEALIFGTSYKLQYRDPFLFLVYEFRKWVLESKLIVCIGYGFGDEHINKIIYQALSQKKDLLLLSISPFEVVDAGKVDEYRKKEELRIARLLEPINGETFKEQIICREMKAKEFMLEKMNREFLGNLFKDEDEPFPTLK
jgi:hypothetical protein